MWKSPIRTSDGTRFSAEKFNGFLKFKMQFLRSFTSSNSEKYQNQSNLSQPTAMSTCSACEYPPICRLTVGTRETLKNPRNTSVQASSRCLFFLILNLFFSYLGEILHECRYSIGYERQLCSHFRKKPHRAGHAERIKQRIFERGVLAGKNVPFKALQSLFLSADGYYADG